MKPALLNAYVRMLPRLRAEESFAAIHEMALAMGHLKPADQKRYLTALERDGGKEAGPTKARTISDLRALGINVIEEPKI